MPKSSVETFCIYILNLSTSLVVPECPVFSLNKVEVSYVIHFIIKYSVHLKNGASIL